MASQGGSSGTKAQPKIAPRQQDLEFGSLLGEGAFARVFHATNVNTGEVYAMKVVEKRQVQALDRKHAIMSEKSMLMSLDHPGIIRLHFALQDDWALYFALELVDGGELAAQISRMGTCSFEFAQFYTAEIVVILEYLRLRRIAHRDLKPENLLLTLRGHLKLIDFDAAVSVPAHPAGDGDAAGGCGHGQLLPCAGTSLYLPPEAVNGTAQLREAFALDLWALGCVVFQMLVGRTPFSASPEYALFQLILRCEYSFPKGFQHQTAEDFVKALLVSEPAARLGMGDKGFNGLKHHTFFGDFLASFDDLVQRRPPPCVARFAAPELLQSLRSEDTPCDFDFASSAECTPEIGQGFVSRKSAQIPVCQSIDASSWQTHAASQFTLSIQQTPSCGSRQEPSARQDGLCCPTGPSSRAASPPPAVQAPSSPPPQPCSQTRLAPAHVQKAAQRFDMPFLERRREVPFLAWQNWLRELVVRRVLKEDEGVVLCGSIVRRSIPCLRPKVLLLTDEDRLLLLDSSGVRLLDEIQLTGSDAGTFTPQGTAEFVLNTPRRRYYCHDRLVGVEEWGRKIEIARARVLRRPV